MDKNLELQINEVVNPMYEAIMDDKAGFSANDVYELQKILTNYIKDLEAIDTTDQSRKDQIIISLTQEFVIEVNNLNTELRRYNFILDSDRDNLITFFNDIAAEFGLSYNEDDITKPFREF